MKIYLEYIFNEGYVSDRITKLYGDYIHEEKPNKDRVKPYIDLFQKHRVAHNLDINKFKDFPSLQHTLNEVSHGVKKTKRQEKKRLVELQNLKEGKDFMTMTPPKDVDPNIQIIVPLNHKASCKIGGAHRYCISNPDDSQWWDEYSQQEEIIFFVIIDPNAKDDAHSHMVASVYPQEYIQLWSKQNKNIDHHYLWQELNIDTNWLYKEADKIRDKYLHLPLGDLLNPKTTQEMQELFETLVKRGYLSYDGHFDFVEKDGKFMMDFEFGSIHINKLTKENNYKIPIAFNYVGKVFSAQKLGLRTLEGFPKEVGELYLSTNNLNSLKGCPVINSGLDVMDNDELESFEGIPNNEVPDNLYMSFYNYEQMLNLLGSMPKTNKVMIRSRFKDDQHHNAQVGGSFLTQNEMAQAARMLKKLRESGHIKEYKVLNIASAKWYTSGQLEEKFRRNI